MKLKRKPSSWQTWQAQKKFLTLKAALSPEERAAAAAVEQRLNNEWSKLLKEARGVEGSFSMGLMARVYVWEHW